MTASSRQHREILSQRFSTLRVGPEIHAYQIQEYFAFRGVLFARGIIEHAEGDLPAFALRFQDGSIVDVVRQSDPIHVSSPKRTCFHFSATLPQGFTSQILLRLNLCVFFAKDHLVIEEPGAQIIANNHFIQAEEKFWTALSAAPPHTRAIEIGARARSGVTRRDRFPSHVEYVGFDIVEGPNVDQVGDAHALSRYFPPDHFDFALSIAVWEHLAMPWKVSVELNHVLKLGGIALICAPQAWPAHEEPWDYFRISSHAWSTLFNRETGFEIVSAGMGFPTVMASCSPLEYFNDLGWHYGYLGSACVIRKIGATRLAWQVETGSVASGNYPF